MTQTGDVVGTCPTCDADGLAWLVIGRHGPLPKREFFNPGGNPAPGAPDGPTLISIGTSYVLNGRNRAESDPSRLQRLFDTIWRDEQLSAKAIAVVQAEEEAKTLVSQLSEDVRNYSNRILTARTFEGDCDVCREWRPR